MWQGEGASAERLKDSATSKTKEKKEREKKVVAIMKKNGCLVLTGEILEGRRLLGKRVSGWQPFRPTQGQVCLSEIWASLLFFMTSLVATQATP